MPVRDIRSRVALDGESGYKQALSEMAKGLSVLNSEMRLNTEQYKGNEDSVEALTSKGILLEQKLSSQKDKVDILRQAYEKSVKQNGEASAKTQDLKIKLNNAETALIGMDRELKNNAAALDKSTQKGKHFNDALDGGTKSGKGLGDVIGGLAGKLGINLPSGLSDSLNGMTNLSGGMATAALGAAAFAAALIKVTQAAFDMTVAQAAAADKVVTMSNATGVAIETLQVLNYAQNLIDVSTETVTSSMARNIRSMDSARDGNKELAESYRDLHVKITDSSGKLRDSEDVYWDVIDALGKVKNETERDALAMTLLGKSAQDLNPMIKIGSAGMAEYAQQAKDAGAVNEDLARQLAGVDDSVQYFNNSMTVAKNTLSGALAPAVGEFIDAGSGLMQVLSEIVNETGLDDFLSVIVKSGAEILKTLGPIMEILGPIVSETLKPIALALGLVADTLIVIGASLGIVIEAINMLLGSTTAASKIFAYGDMITGVFTGKGATAAALKMYGVGNNADGTNSWRGGLTWVGERGPELVNLPRGSAVYSNQQSMAMGAVYVTIDAKNVREFNDVVRMAQNARLTARAGVARR